MTIKAGSDTLIKSSGLKVKTADTETVVTDATVTAALYDSLDNVVASNISMPHVSNGLYEGVLLASLNLVAGTRYKLVVTALSGTTPLIETQYHQCIE